MPRNNFYFRFEWSQDICYLDPLERLEVYEATFLYARTGETAEMSTRAAEAFNKFILPVFRRREKAAEYRARRKARLAAEAAAKSASQVAVLASLPADAVHPFSPEVEGRDERKMKVDSTLRCRVP